MDSRVWGTKIVIEAGCQPSLKIPPSPVGINVRRPCDRERMHAILITELVGSVEGIFAAGAGDDAVVGAVFAAVAVAEFNEFELSGCPVNLAFLLCHTARIADALVVEMDRFFPAGLDMAVLPS